MEWLVAPWVVGALLFCWLVVRRCKWVRRLGVVRPYSWYLEAPPAYWAAPPEIRARLCNGAGPAGAGWLVPDRIWGVTITEAANIHDWMYVWGETESDKNRADMTFLVNMLRILTEHTTGFPVVRQILLWFRHRRALTYYEAVADFGNRAFATARTVRPAGYVAGLPIQETMPCTKPPYGWHCTRAAGHPGPCAAVPDIELEDRV